MTTHQDELTQARRELLRRRLAGGGVGVDDARPRGGVPQRPTGDVPVLSSAQTRLWFMEQFAPGTAAYAVPVAARLDGPLDAERLRAALGHLTRRHEVLRSRVVAGEDDRPRIVLMDEVDVPVRTVSTPGEAMSAPEVEAEVDREIATPFALDEGPLLRALLIEVTAEEHVLVLTMHHLVADGWSTDLALREVMAHYRGEDLPTPRVQYYDYAAWQRGHEADGTWDDALARWRERLTGLAPLDLPTDRPRPATQSFDGAAHGFEIPGDVVRGLADLARAHGATTYMGLLAAYQILLSRLSGQEQFAIGSPVAGRSRAELEPLIGMFVNLVALPCDLAGRTTFLDVLGATRETVVATMSDQDVPFDVVVRDLDLPRDTSRSPLFQATFSMQTYHEAGAEHAAEAIDPGRAPSSLESTWMPVRLPATRFDLELYATPVDDGLACLLTYATALFDESTIARSAEHLVSVLRWVVTHADEPLAAMSLVSEDERERVLDWGRRRTTYPDAGDLVTTFERSVAAAPDAVALTHEATHLTYAALNALANRIAHGLRARGFGSGDLLALRLERGVEQIAAVLGVLKCGAAYVPLDPANPEDRLTLITEDSGARAVLDAEALRDLLEGSRDETDPGDTPRPDDVAYVIYTSGSTGRPKGVPVTHRAVSRLLLATAEEFDVGPTDVWVMVHSYAFDFSVWEMWGAFGHGGRLVVPPLDVVRDQEALLDLLERERVTVLNQTPAAFGALRAALVATGRSFADTQVREIVFGGDMLQVRDLRQWFAEHGDSRPRLVNMYGITETTVHATVRPLTRRDARGRVPSPIGRPLADLSARVLDPDRNLVPIGVPGELYVGGDGVCGGYLGLPELTTERFVADPFCDDEHAGPLYRSGDRVRWTESGELEYLGRLDAQVKIRGYRIEPGEVEAALRGHPAVSDALVVPRGHGSERILVGYVTLAGTDVPTQADLREHVRAGVPPYMVPTRVVILDAFPVTANGKIDVRALPEPSDDVDDQAEFVEPDTDAQRLVAQVWREILEVERVGVHDDFFALGGHSLLATQVVARLRRAGEEDGSGLRGRVTVMDMFRTPTLGAIAGLLDAAPPDPDEANRLLYELTRTDPATRERTYVCIPYGGGSAVIFQPLADQLPERQALYAVATHGQDVGRVDDTLPLEEIADACVQEILDGVPGPLVLYGHCGVGATLAVQIATRLEEAGRELDAVYVGAIFPFARPRGVLGTVSRIAQPDGVRSRRTYVNRLTAQGVDVAELGDDEIDRIVRNMRHDSTAAEEYFGSILHERSVRLRAPIVSVVGDQDLDTDMFAERFREWSFLSDTVGLVVLTEAGHYFPRYRASELAQIVTRSDRAVVETGQRLAAEGSAEVPEVSGSGDLDVAERTWWLQDVHRYGTRTASSVEPSMRRFLGVVSGQLLCVIGSATTAWAIPLWIYLTTGSIANFALFVVLGMVPGLLIAPLTGALVDRWDRRRTMMGATIAGGLVQVGLGSLLWTDNLQLWHIYVLQVLLSLTNTVQRVSYVASVGQLVPKHFLGHAMGAVQLVNSLATTCVPLLAVALLGTIGLGGIVAIEIVTFALVTIIVALVKFPNTLHWRPREPLVQEIAGGFRFVWRTPGFKQMLGFFLVFNLALAAPMVMVAPLVLSFGVETDAARIGVIQGSGAVIAAFIVLIWGGPARRMRGVLLSAMAMGLAVIWVGTSESLVVIGSGVFLMAGSLAMLNGIYGTIVQVKVPQRLHGRVFALNQMVSWSTLPLGFLLVAPLGTALFEPLLMPGGALADSVGRVIGVGEGRGMAFLFMVLGAIMVLIALLARTVPMLRRFDDVVPDALADDLLGLQTLGVEADPDPARTRRAMVSAR